MRCGGGEGSDTVDFDALDEAGGTIWDFAAGAGGDRIDLRDLLAAGGYAGDDALGDGVVRAIADGAHAQVQIAADPAGEEWTTVATLLDVNAATLVADNWVI